MNFLEIWSVHKKIMNYNKLIISKNLDRNQDEQITHITKTQPFFSQFGQFRAEVQRMHMHVAQRGTWVSLFAIIIIID